MERRRERADGDPVRDLAGGEPARTARRGGGPRPGRRRPRLRRPVVHRPPARDEGRLHRDDPLGARDRAHRDRRRGHQPHDPPSHGDRQCDRRPRRGLARPGAPRARGGLGRGALDRPRARAPRRDPPRHRGLPAALRRRGRRSARLRGGAGAGAGAGAARDRGPARADLPRGLPARDAAPRRRDLRRGDRDGGPRTPGSAAGSSTSSTRGWNAAVAGERTSPSTSSSR